MWFQKNLKTVFTVVLCLSIPCLGAEETLNPLDIEAQKAISTTEASAETALKPLDVGPEKPASTEAVDIKAPAPQVNEAQKDPGIEKTEPIEEPAHVSTFNTSVSPGAEASVAANPVRILEFVLANKIEGREPKDIVEETFSRENGTGMAYAFARLSAQKPAQVTFVWFREGKEHNRFTTNVQASQKWRTFSSTKLRPGNWKVQLMVGSEVLAERAFTVQ